MTWRPKAALAALAVAAVAVGCGGQSPPSCPSPTGGGQECAAERVAPANVQSSPLAAPQPPPLAAGYANGRLPQSALAPATGCSTGLASRAAAAWNHVAVIVHAHTGYWLQSNGSASCYRTYAQQVDLRNYWCGQGNCANAAVPGTSNHGWGLAVDAPPATVTYVHRYGGGLFGQGYGSCSDAPWESWHIKYCGGYTGGDPGPNGSGGGPTHHGFPTLRHGSKGQRVHRLQVHLFYLHNTGAGSQNAGYLAKWSYTTGFYGSHTKYAVRKLQHDGNLTRDGVYGKNTAAYQWNRWQLYCKHHHKGC